MDQKQKLKNQNYTVVVLAAGYGSRISEITDKPKCLLELNGKSLLERNFHIWKKLGIKKINLVVGYRKELIQDIAEKYKSDFDFNIFINEDYRSQGNTFSLYLGLKDIVGPSLIFDADLVYELETLDDFIESGWESKILIGKGCLSDVECAKTLVDSSNFARMTVDKREVSKDELEKFNFAGEAIGILKFCSSHTQSLAHMASEFLSKKENINLNWEHLLNIFLLEKNVGVHKVTSRRWVEIDTPEDFREAQTLFEK